MKDLITTIQVHGKTRDRLASRAVYGESLEDVIIKMLDKEDES